jgi:acetylornithine/succinyldiaminopimelate/putrescine aminotransferase
LAATGQPAKHEPFAPMPDGFIHAPWGDLAAIEAAVDETVGAVFLESIQGEGGVNPAPDGYLEGVREICTRKGALMMIDEVQTGFARTGEWFGFEHSGVSPDVVTLAKAMGNGMPIGACWAPVEVAAAFVPGDHGSTYSGTALATAAVEAVIAEMKRLDARSLARVGESKIRAILDGADGVIGVRGNGLLLGVALEDGIIAGDVAAEALANGLIVNAVNGTTIRIAPPLTVSEGEIEEAMAILLSAIATVKAAP